MVTFLVDTGATRSILHPSDALRLGLDPLHIADDPRSELARGVGGPAHMVVMAMLLDFAEDVARVRPYALDVGVAESTSSNLTLPSILGMDFIQHFRLTVSVRDDRVELEPLFDGG